MNLELGTQFLIGFTYMLLLFAIAYVVDRRLIPTAIASHPLSYTLSLGVFASSWCIFGIVPMTGGSGHAYMSYFVGVGSLFLFAPLLLLPLLLICRRYQLTSLADLLAFRYRGTHVGAAVTIGMLAASLPLIAAQLKIVSNMATILSGHAVDSDTQSHLGLIFAFLVAAFAIWFGARQISDRERHNGLIVTIALHSAVKLIAFLLLGLFAVSRVFDGPAAMIAWVGTQPELVGALHDSTRSSSTHIYMLTFFAAAVGMPHLFHMALYENPSMHAVSRATWGLPLFLLLLSLPVLPVLWAGSRLELDMPSEYFAAGLGVAANSPWAALLALMIGLSAASSTIIVLALALASMTMNNLLLPFYRLGKRGDLYRGLVLVRSLLIAILILAAHFFSIGVAASGSLEKLGFAAFIASAQFLPGVLALLYWPDANRRGFLSGLAAGFAVWLMAVLVPESATVASQHPILLPIAVNDSWWATVMLNSVGLNTLALIVISLISSQGREEREAAAICSLDNLSGRGRHQLQLRTPAEFITGLTRMLGQNGALREVQKALHDLGYSEDETRPYAMRRLRDRIEANLSRLVGAAVAMEVVTHGLPYVRDESNASSEDIYFVESRLETYQRYLTGFAAEVDELRRFYRNTLQDLPVGVVGINANDEAVMWNHALETLTGIRASDILGLKIDELPQPWGRLAAAFIESDKSHLHSQRVPHDTRNQWVSLHKALADGQQSSGTDARFIVIEDVTETQLLQLELIHSERLASIGRLAAGVAHEIGNPVTGIDCLAQNLLAESDEDTTLQGARQILNQTQRISNIVQALVNFAHSGVYSSGVQQTVNMHQCVDEAIYLLKLDHSARDVCFRNLCDEEQTLCADAQRLLQVFVNLLANARDAVENNGEIRIESCATADGVSVSVSDDGSGIPTAIQDQVFEPFFTTKAPGRGTGLGLSLVYAIIRDMQGSVAIRSPLDELRRRGTEVRVYLPYTTRN